MDTASSPVARRVRIDCSRIKEGVMFSAPVYFNDGENMFLAANHTAKKYHVEVLKRWEIPFLWTAGKELEGEVSVLSQSDPSFNSELDDQGITEEFE